MTTCSPALQKHYRTHYYLRYRLGAGLLIFFGLFLLLIAALAPFIKSPSFSDWKMVTVLGLVGMLCLIIAVLGPYGESQTRLVTSPEGIEYQGFGFRVLARWENIERVAVILRSQYALEPDKTTQRIYDKISRFALLEGQYPENHLECLVLRQPVCYDKKPWARRLIRNQTQYIPLSEFPRWRDSGLGEDIRRYAPHVS
ncbi:MAG: hypothetical protein JW726_18050 [Anaerolineales bacterium]|nr:hypothetical protein [Anaerolineales bacterium]